MDVRIKITENFFANKSEIMDDLNFVINKIIAIDGSLTQREIGFYIGSAFSFYCSFYEKFSNNILLRFQDIITKCNNKSIEDYLIAASYRNSVPKEKDLDSFNVLKTFKENFDRQEKSIASNFVMANKGIDSIFFVSSFIGLSTLSDGDFRSYKNTYFSDFEISKLSLITNFKNLEEILKKNYNNRNNVCHGQFKTIESFSIETLKDDAIVSLLSLKLYIQIISDGFVAYINRKIF